MFIDRALNNRRPSRPRKFLSVPVPVISLILQTPEIREFSSDDSNAPRSRNRSAAKCAKIQQKKKVGQKEKTAAINFGTITRGKSIMGLETEKSATENDCSLRSQN